MATIATQKKTQLEINLVGSFDFVKLIIYITLYHAGFLVQVLYQETAHIHVVKH